MELPRTARHAEVCSESTNSLPWVFHVLVGLVGFGLFWYFLSFAIYRLCQLSVTLAVPLPASDMTSPSLEFPTLRCCSLGMSHPCMSPHNQSKPMCLRLLSCQWQRASLWALTTFWVPLLIICIRLIPPTFQIEGRTRQDHLTDLACHLPSTQSQCSSLPPPLPSWATLTTKGTSDSECFSHEKIGLPV